ncbi:MAG: aminotransferase class III-fold pyridoxal phosphate-dependent enzyme [Pseudomonadota bacterium]|nr:aminotransferase class III-fold pyridoxal phosphate-dependent enzyme [Pseudomonadota bacterium]
MENRDFNAILAEQEHLLQVYDQYEIEPVNANGVWLKTRDGQKILDMYGGHAVASLGYNHPAIIKALGNQAQTLFFQSNAVALEIRAQAAEKLSEFSPKNLNTVFLVNSGAEANENALRIALKKTGRKKVLAIEHGFHGRTAAAASVSWGAKDKWYGFPSTPFDVDFIPRENKSKASSMINETVGAVIIELVQGIAGAFELSPEFIKTIADKCKSTNTVLIIDEVQTGVGRCGSAFAIDFYGIEADIITTAKGLGSGFPCGALLMNNLMAEGLSNGDLGSTFGGGPIACALIDAVISTINSDNLMESVNILSKRIKKECVTGPVEAISGKGFLLGLHCPDGAKPVIDGLMKQGILVGSSSNPNILRLLPPLILQHEHVDMFIAALKTVK